MAGYQLVPLSVHRPGVHSPAPRPDSQTEVNCGRDENTETTLRDAASTGFRLDRGASSSRSRGECPRSRLQVQSVSLPDHGSLQRRFCGWPPDVIIEVLTSSWTRYLALPVLTVLSGIFIKWNARKEQWDPFSRDDFAVGLELMATSVLLMFSSITEQAIPATSASGGQVPAKTLDHILLQVVVAGAILVAIVIATFVVRRWGWEKKGRRSLWWGLIVPDVLGVASLLTVLALASRGPLP